VDVRTFLLAVLALVALELPARADIAWGVGLGGGLEGGMITGALRPDGVAEAGMMVEYIPTGGIAGIGASIEAIGRLTSRFDDAEEVKSDVMFRWARGDRKVRFGVGAGLRWITPKAGDSIHGFDLFRLDMSGELGSWQPVRSLARLSIDAYFSWTFGCYSDSYRGPAQGDMLPAKQSIDCLGSITTTYVGGLRTTMRWR
jgi:hypothetical protein